MQSIVLYWPPASWKTTTGESLAQMLWIPHIDTDTLIKERTKQSITNIIETKWETYFRDIEANTLLEVCHIIERQQIIASLWWWALLRRENLWFIKQAWAQIFLLTWVWDMLYERIKNDISRPLMQTREAFDGVMKERISHYEEFPNIIKIDRKSPEQIGKEILQKTQQLITC